MVPFHRARVSELERQQIRTDVELRHAAELARAGWLRRIAIRFRVEREVEFELRRRASFHPWPR